MITAYELERANITIEEAKRIAQSEMPKAEFVLKGIDNEFVYFNLVAKVHNITDEQKEDVIAKTRFIPIEINETPVYIGKFKIGIFK